MLYLFEDGNGNSQLKGRKFPLPDGIKGHIRKIVDSFQGDRNTAGFKRLENLLENPSVSYSEMKRIKNFFDNYQGDPTDLEYQLNGGQPMQTWVNLTLSNATGAIRDTKQAMKDAGIKNAFIKHHNKNRTKTKPTTQKVNVNGDLSKNLKTNSAFKFESKQIINEDLEDYYSEYDEGYVLLSFLYGNDKVYDWGVLINPSMYQKALNEFTRFGHFEKFPVKYIFQWWGIICKNTCVLNAMTTLAGHGSFIPTEVIEDEIDAIEKKFGKKLLEEGNDEDSFEISDKEIIEYFESFKPYDLQKVYRLLNLNEDAGGGVHNYGNLKGQRDLFFNQEETDRYDKEKSVLDANKSQANKTQVYAAIAKLAQREYCSYEMFAKEGKMFIKTSILNILDDIGLYDYFKLPDGSDAWSDFGLEPLFKIIQTYDEGMTAEQVIVLINRALDVYHRRGDIASAFIQGGTKTLSQISDGQFVESKKKNKKIIFSESFLNLLKSKH